MGVGTMRSFALISRLLRGFERFANGRVTVKKSVKNQMFFSSILLTCKSVRQIAFSGWIFYGIVSAGLGSA